MHLREHDLFAVRWSERILDEARRSLVGRGKPLDKVEARLAAMRRAFPDANVTGFEDLIPSLRLPDPDDRHVLAAAILGGAAQIVTKNLRDFPTTALNQYDIEAVSPDGFLLNTLDLYPEITIQTIQQRAITLTRPAIGINGILQALEDSGAPEFASEVRRHVL